MVWPGLPAWSFGSGYDVVYHGGRGGTELLEGFDRVVYWTSHYMEVPLIIDYNQYEEYIIQEIACFKMKRNYYNTHDLRSQI